MSLSYLHRPEGRIAYDVTGPDAADNPLVLCVPGMGELRQTYRLLVPRLVEHGYRVATMDIRGHGDSDATFDAYDDVALAGDILALVDELGSPAYVVGNSMGAAGGVLAAVEEPSRVRGLVLLGPFVRDPAGARWQRLLQGLLLRVLLSGPWGRRAFMGYYPRWLPGSKPDGHDEHTARIRESLRRPGHWRAFQRTTRTSHAPAERVLPEVQAPAVVVMGTADPDWKSPAAEADWVGRQLRADVVLVPGIGHFPQVQAAEVTADAVRRVVGRTSDA